MNISNITQLLGGASKLAGNNSSLLASGAAAAGPYGVIAAKALDKFAEKLPGIVDKLQNGLENAKSFLAENSANSLAFYPPGGNGPTPINSALNLVKQWDSNEDGVLSKEELQKGLDSVQEKINQQADKLKSNNDPIEMARLYQLKGMQALGQKMLGGYDGITKLDNQSGISNSDIKLLAFQDKNPYLISNREFLKLTETATV